MAEFTKPPKLENVWASVGAKTPNPDDTKIATGWLAEIPPKEFFNYIEYKQDQMLAHLNQRGIAQWDTSSSYLAGKSFTQGSNGIIYKAKTDHSAVDPVLESGAGTSTGGVNWKLAFYAAADVYTKLQTDSFYLNKSNNLVDLPNTLAARTNLSVYSIAEADARYPKIFNNLSDLANRPVAFENIKQLATDTFAGVSQFATDAELNSGSVDNKKVSPLKLKLGVSVTLSTNGHIRLPNWLGGLQIAWGNYTSAKNSTTGVTFTRPFNAACTSIVASFSENIERGDISLSISNRSTSGFISNYHRDGSGGAGVACNYIAVGY